MKAMASDALRNQLAAMRFSDRGPEIRVEKVTFLIVSCSLYKQK